MCVDTDNDALIAMAGQLLAETVVDIIPLAGGGNNRLFRITAASGTEHALKHYYKRVDQQQSRVSIECNALDILRSQGVTSVPTPVARDDKQNVAIFEYIAGNAIDSAAITVADLQAVVAFIKALQRVSLVTLTNKLPDASEACFSYQAMCDAIERRLKVFNGIHAADLDRLRAFLKNDFQPVFDHVREACLNIDADKQEAGVRVLSPSDFGLHNAIRRDSGEIVFIDFEYFGWDMFEKMIADFLLHPGMELDSGMQSAFLSLLKKDCLDWQGFRSRLHWVYPLSALKWCLILLNEFNPARLQQRVAVAQQSFDVERRRNQQLQRAGKMLNKLEMEGCLYSCPV